MNFVNCDPTRSRMLETQTILCLLLCLLLSICFAGCSDEVQPASAEQLTQFRNAGPQQPSIDMDLLVSAKIGGGPHRAVPGEVLELTMPTILQVVTAEEPETSGKVAPHICRISNAGTITLPVVGEIDVEGKTLAEVELAVTDAYHPEYTVTRPSVLARVLEYKTADVSITGAVNKPGIYSLRSDQMSLVALLMEAEGIIDEGAAFIRIIRADQEAAGNEVTRIRETHKSVEQQPEWNQERLSSPLAHHANFGEIDVQLKFRPPKSSSTRGGLTITYGERILLAEELDIASEVERRAMLERLIQREPRVSGVLVNQRLCALAELLDRGSVTGNGENESEAQDTISVAKLDSSELGKRPWPEKSVGRELPVATAVGDQVLYASAVPKLRYGLLERRHGVVSENAGLYDDFSTADPGRLPATRETIYRTDSRGRQDTKSLILPVKGLNIPFTDVALRDGDRVIVERLRAPMITVVGLVNRAGNFPYPPNVEYNLMHALGFAGGLNLSAEPRYATVYRLAADGTTVSAVFNVAGVAKSLDPTDALRVILKPYDVIAVEHTPRTRAKVFWDRVFRFYISTYIRADDILGED